MDIFGIGVLELLFILILAMIVVGPRDLSKVGRQMGRFLNRMYRSESWRMLNEASRTLRNLPNRLAREAALEDLDSVRDSLKEAGREIQSGLKKADPSLQAWTPQADGVETPSDRSPAEEGDPPNTNDGESPD